MPACCINVRSVSHRDSGHCSGYQAVPRRIGGAPCSAARATANAVKKIKRTEIFKNDFAWVMKFSLLGDDKSDYCEQASERNSLDEKNWKKNRGEVAAPYVTT